MQHYILDENGNPKPAGTLENEYCSYDGTALREREPETTGGASSFICPTCNRGYRQSANDDASSNRLTIVHDPKWWETTRDATSG